MCIYNETLATLDDRRSLQQAIVFTKGVVAGRCRPQLKLFKNNNGMSLSSGGEVGRLLEAGEPACVVAVTPIPAFTIRFVVITDTL